MKKLLLSTLILTAFATALLLFDLSCKKTSFAQTSIASTQQSKIVFVKEYYGGSGTQNFDYGKIWTANYDGTNQQEVNITLPTNVVIALVAPKVSPDGKTIFFNAFLTDGKNDIGNWGVYSANIDGSNVKQIVADANVSTTIAAAF